MHSGLYPQDASSTLSSSSSCDDGTCVQTWPIMSLGLKNGPCSRTAAKRMIARIGGYPERSEENSQEYRRAEGCAERGSLPRAGAQTVLQSKRRDTLLAAPALAGLRLRGGTTGAERGEGERGRSQPAGHTPAPQGTGGLKLAVDCGVLVPPWKPILEVLLKTDGDEGSWVSPQHTAGSRSW